MRLELKDIESPKAQDMIQLANKAADLEEWSFRLIPLQSPGANNFYGINLVY